MADNASDIVVFHDADGNEISNDPRWYAKKLMAQDEDNRRRLLNEAEEDDLDDMNGKELKETAKNEGVDITGLTKVNEVRVAIRAARAANSGVPE